MATAQQSESQVLAQSRSTRPNPNDIAIVPYSEIDGVWTLPDDLVISIARECQLEGTFKRVFYEGKIRTPQDFLAGMKSRNNVPVFAFQETRCLGFAWLNGNSGSHAFAHFCTLRRAWGGLAHEVCRLFLDYWWSFRADSGAALLDLIIGVISERNTRAVRFTEKLGFVRLGVIPKMIHDVYEGERQGAVILYYSRYT